MFGFAAYVLVIALVIWGAWRLHRRWHDVDSYYDQERSDALPSDVSSWIGGGR